MCNLAQERKRIDELLLLALKSDAARKCRNAGELSQIALIALRAHYDDKCPDECIRWRCEEFAMRNAPNSFQQAQPSTPPPA